MGTIPASAIVTVNPNVIGAGGNALQMIGLLLSSSARVPIDEVLSFPSAAGVSDYFGATSDEAAAATVYFNGFDNSNVKPGAVLFAQYNQNAGAAYLRGGDISGLTLTQLQALSGTLAVVVDGYSRSAASINLAAATSFSAAAALIQTGLNTAPVTGASFTGSIAAGTAAFTASIAGTIMTVSALASGSIAVGGLLTGTGGGGVTAGTRVVEQLTGSSGSIGTYVVSAAQIISSTAIAEAYGVLTVSAVASGTLSIGQTVNGTGVTAATLITALRTGGGLTGTYVVDTTQTAISAAMTGISTDVVVSYDSVSGAFVITSGISGEASTVAFATGALSASLLLTSATGAVLSQGAAPATPAAFMDALMQRTQNWVSFMTVFDPDEGSGNTQKLAFAAWENAQNDRYVYVVWDDDVTPSESDPAATSLGDLIDDASISGVCLISRDAADSIDATMAAFICGSIASIDFTQTNGRITFAFKSQTGLTPTVTNETAAQNLGGDPQAIGDRGNGYNFYGAYATAASSFVFFNRGFVSGPFLWLDSYINQIWLNNALQLALIEMQRASKSVPYNPAGYALIDAACQDPITAALNFGAIRPNVPLSAAQAAEVNAAAGTKIDDILSTVGFYLQIKSATAQVRAARASPPCTLWYTDGQSIQAINLTSVEVA